jgi:primosomal protein N' (replication factor Y)
MSRTPKKPPQGLLFETQPAPWEEDEGEIKAIAQVVFPEPPWGPYDYEIPPLLLRKVMPGARVDVPLGRGDRSVTGYCASVTHTRVVGRKLKLVTRARDVQPLITPAMLDLTRWMSDHYLCPQGQVLEGVIPAGVRFEAGTRETILVEPAENLAAKLVSEKLTENQRRVIDCLIGFQKPVTPKELSDAAGSSLATIQTLRKRKLIVAHRERMDTGALSKEIAARQSPHQLHPDQVRALETIEKLLASRQSGTVLLHGVTGSGKTEVYVRAMESVVQFGRQAIILVPEISLTPQTVERFRARFDQVAVLHSHLSDVDRHRHWKRIRAGEVQVIVGARSAVFAPTPNLGIIVIDEEHDQSFKQSTVPRYHARAVAEQRAKRENVPLVLGTATPSLESWHEVLHGRSTLVTMPVRVAARPLPIVDVIDLRNEFRERVFGGAISLPMKRAIHEALAAKGQVILLLNRRGYSTSIQCPACGVAIQCPNCDISLTHHKQGQKAVCHYCDYESAVPERCPDCGRDEIRFGGLGTQKLEGEVKARFPNARVLRMDSDTMKKHGSHESALTSFRNHEVDILLGTQMIAKGLDFPDVTLVGVINADSALHFPDFRASERTFQLVTQVAGRTGRGEKGGRVLVQTSSPEHPAIRCALTHDFDAFAEHALTERAEYFYPPFTSLIRIIIRGPDEASTSEFSKQVGAVLAKSLQDAGDAVRILGPATAPLPRLRNYYRFHIILQAKEAAVIREAVSVAQRTIVAPEKIEWTVDVDPQDML